MILLMHARLAALLAVSNLIPVLLARTIFHKQ